MAVLALAAAGLSAVPAVPAAAAVGAPVMRGLTPETGPPVGGVSVTITGTGLAGASAVSFGDVVAPLFRVEGNAGEERIVAFSPRQAAGTVAVVRVWAGGVASAPDGPVFTYVGGVWDRIAEITESLVRSGTSAILLDRPGCHGTTPPPGYPCDRVLVAGGGNDGLKPDQIYDAAERGGTGTWAPTERLGGGDHVVTLLGDGRVLATGGRSAAGTAVSSAKLFDPTAPGRFAGVDVAGHWSAAPNMGKPRWRHTATVLDRADCHGASPPADGYPCGKVLVAGGLDGRFEPQGSVELFDPAGAGSWATDPPPAMPSARAGHSATLLGDGTVLVAGGADSNGGYVATAALYDPTAPTTNAGRGAWTTLDAPMKLPRSGHTAMLLDPPDCHGAGPPPDYSCGKVLVAGGGVLGGALPPETAEVYDPGTRTWADAGGSAVLSPGGHAGALLAGGTVLAVSRAARAGVSPAALFEPAAGTWSPVAGLPTWGSTSFSVTALGDGRALAANVQTGKFGGTGAYVFDPLATADTTPAVQAMEPASGPLAGGTRVVVRGSHLFGAPDAGRLGTSTVVRFGDTPAAAVEFVSDAELVATSPPHARGQVAVAVTTPGGTSTRVGAAVFTYVDEGAWAPTGALDACKTPSDSSRSCAPRSDGRAVLLDPPACQGDDPPAGYPCGSVLAVGRTKATFTDGVLTIWPGGSATLSSASAAFSQPDVGLAVSATSTAGNTLPDGTTVKTVIDARTVELLSPVHPAGPVGTPSTLARFVLGGNSAQRYDPSTGGWRATGAMRTKGTAFGTDEFFGPNDIPSTTTLLPDGTVLVTGGCCGRPFATSSRIDASKALDTAELYDPVHNTWSDTTPLPAARVGHSATLLDRPDCHGPTPPSDGYPCGQVLVAGGRAVPDQPELEPLRRTAYLYNPLGAGGPTWAAAGTPGAPRMLHSATLLANGDVLVVGGLDDQSVVLATAELYHPARGGSWSPAAPAPEPEILHSATLLDRPDCHVATHPTAYPCGRVLVAGGTGADFSTAEYNPSGNGRVGTASVHLYDPDTGTWTTSSGPGGGGPEPMTTGRSAHSATLLPDGDVLVAGGYVDALLSPGFTGSPATPSAEVYEPASRRWRVVVPMDGRRTAHSATVLEGRGCAPRCGQVVVAGGRTNLAADPGVGPRLASAELYTPAPAVSSLAPASGPSHGGAQVVIGGTSLAGATQVRFGGVPAPITSSSLTALTVTTPEHQAGPVEVEVVTPAGSTTVRAEAERRTYTFAASRPPGPVDPLEAEAVSPSAVRLRFSAASSDGPLPPPARRYEVKVATGPIVDDAGFAAAAALCGGECAFSPPAVGAALSLNVGGLAPGTTYHFAARALGDVGPGPLSNPASATTGGDPEGPPEIAGPPPTVTPPSPSCPALGPPAPGQVAYPAGYSMVGLPQGSVVGMGSSLYSWFDQGAGGRYSTHSPTQALAGGRGYWAWFACPRLVGMGPGGATVTSLPLGAYRASMVGNPTTRAVSVAGYDWAARWDPRLNNGAGGYRLSGYRQAQALAPGEGIWVFSYKATTVTLR